jgi:hypothetical protein
VELSVRRVDTSGQPRSVPTNQRSRVQVQTPSTAPLRGDVRASCCPVNDQVRVKSQAVLIPLTAHTRTGFHLAVLETVLALHLPCACIRAAGRQCRKRCWLCVAGAHVSKPSWPVAVCVPQQHDTCSHRKGPACFCACCRCVAEGVWPTKPRASGEGQDTGGVSLTLVHSLHGARTWTLLQLAYHTESPHLVFTIQLHCCAHTNSVIILTCVLRA